MSPKPILVSTRAYYNGNKGKSLSCGDQLNQYGIALFLLGGYISLFKSKHF